MSLFCEELRTIDERIRIDFNKKFGTSGIEDIIFRVDDVREKVKNWVKNSSEHRYKIGWRRNHDANNEFLLYFCNFYKDLDGISVNYIAKDFLDDGEYERYIELVPSSDNDFPSIELHKGTLLHDMLSKDPDIGYILLGLEMWGLQIIKNGALLQKLYNRALMLQEELEEEVG